MTPKHKKAIKIFERDNFQCQYCGVTFAPEQPPLHRHRRVFGSQGGSYDDFNVATCCFKCHQSDNHHKLKNARLFHEEDDSKINEIKKRYEGER